MKLENFNDNLFQNKPYISIKNEIDHLKIRAKSLKIEIDHISVKLRNLRLQYMATYHQNILIRDDSPEYAEYQKNENILELKITKLWSVIKDITQNALQLSSKEMFDEQKDIHIKAGLPTQIINPPRIPTGPHITTENPARNKDATNIFVGLPWDYPRWSDKTIKQYTALSKYLKSKNMMGFTKVYSATIDNLTKTIMLADNGSFIWRCITTNLGSGGIVHSSVRYNGGLTMSTKQFIRTVKP
jgi:hypothetical protein